MNHLTIPRRDTVLQDGSSGDRGGGGGDILFLLIPPERKSKDQLIYQRDVDKCVRIL